MISKTFPIKIDINSNKVYLTNIQLVSSDLNTYIFQITINDGVSTLDLSSVDIAYIYFKKPDGSIIKDTITIIDAINGILSYTFDNSTILSVVGKYESEIRFCNTDETIMITSQKFSFNVRLSI
jgi:hypothetical protein